MIIHNTCSLKQSIDLLGITPGRRVKVIYIYPFARGGMEKIKRLYPASEILLSRSREAIITTKDITFHVMEYLPARSLGCRADLIILQDVEMGWGVVENIFPTITTCMAKLSEAKNKSQNNFDTIIGRNRESFWYPRN